MAADKTIFECPVYTLYTQLDGAQRMIIQPDSGSAFDYGVPLSLLAQWLFSTYNIGVFGGSANPDPTAGNNGDLYFQTNGKIYQKTAGGWVLKVTMPVPGGQTVTTVTAGTSLITITIPHPGVVNPFPFMKDLSGNQYTGATWADDGTNIIVTAPDDGTGHSADSFEVIIPSAIGGGSGAIGPAGGDLTLTYPNPKVNQINGFPANRYNPTSDIQGQLDSKQPALGFTPYNATNPANYITAAAIPVNVSAFSNDADYATVDQVKVSFNGSYPGLTASLADAGHATNIDGIDQTYIIATWLNFLSGTGNVIIQLTWVDGHSNTFTETFYRSGDVSGSTYGAGIAGAAKSYSFDVKTIRAKAGSLIQISTTAAGTVDYEVGGFINKIVGDGGL